MNRQAYRVVELFVLVGICVTGGLFQQAFASRVPTPPLNPTTYRSASGQYALHVNPSDRQGRGKGTYRMLRDGNEIWREELPFTLREARVLDDGTTAGYGYTLGPEGYGGKSDDGHGELVIAILDPNGGVRLKGVFTRVQGNFSIQLPQPVVDEILVDPENGRFVVLISDIDVNRQNTTWRQYQLSTGKLVGEFRPKEKLDNNEWLYWCHMPRSISGTPLTLVQWFRSTNNPYLKGTYFAIIDMKGNPVWQKILPDDYTVPGDEAAEELLWNWFREDSAILSVAAKGKFELAFAKEKKRVAFVVKRDEKDQWIVTETGRKAWEVPQTVDDTKTPAEKAAEAALARIPDKTLDYLGAVTLPDAKSDTPAGKANSSFNQYDLRGSVVDDEGRFIFTRTRDKKIRELVRVDQEGNEVDRISLPPTAVEEWTRLRHAWLGGDRFIVVDSPFGMGAKSKARIADLSRNKPTPLPDFSCPDVSSIAGLPDGRFFILATERFKYTMVTALHGYDARGKLQWIVREGQLEDRERLFSPESICITPDGLIAVVENIGDKVKFFDFSGKFVRLIDLEKAWGRDPSYPTDINPLPNGELIISDAVASGGSYVQMTAKGKIVKEFRLSLASGQDLATGLIVGPDGRFWAPYGSSILELDEKGVAKRAIGEPPTPERLFSVSGATMDRQGRLFVLDELTYCLHVFNHEGKRLFVCKPNPSDAGADSGVFPNTTITHTGEILVQLPGSEGYLRFSPTGERLGIARLGQDSVTEEWYCLPGIDRRWVKCYEEIHLVDSKDKVLKTIERRPNDDWLQRPDALAVGPDGSFGVIDDPTFSSGGWQSFNLFSATGKPIRTFPAPASRLYRLAYNGHLIAAIGFSGPLLLYDTSGKALLRCDLDKYLTENRDRFLFFSPDGKELRILDADTRTLHRFALPKLG